MHRKPLKFNIKYTIYDICMCELNFYFVYFLFYIYVLSRDETWTLDMDILKQIKLNTEELEFIFAFHMCAICLSTQFHTENHSIYIMFLNTLRHHRQHRPTMNQMMKGEIVNGSGRRLE